ncbi:TOX high mobility group box family member 4 isoform X2 [Drosophila innubila]|uniref:TOX high mobility group box family member 4 isoform X2 n=1 Tax=Drosophila innubila TaxID=198719 RepID=UPI00148BA52B|nr:TOX high mobility group box family member 4 isoform X2 [Drosophila innubila]
MKKLLSRRLSRLTSLDHTTLSRVDDDEEDPMDYDTANTYGSQQQQQPQQSQQQPPAQGNQAPAKPLAAYALFFRDTMTAIKQQNPACTLEQITAIALNMWESMDEKQRSVYDQRHEVEKREYFRQLRDYQRNQQLEETAPQQQQLHEEEQQSSVPLPVHDEVPNTTAITAAAPDREINSAVLPQPPDQIQLLTEAAAVQQCMRDQCNKPAIINPDWEDEYCSNECVVIHCRNVFTEWARSLQNSPT